MKSCYAPRGSKPEMQPYLAHQMPPTTPPLHPRQLRRWEKILLRSVTQGHIYLKGISVPSFIGGNLMAPNYSFQHP